MTPNSSSSTFWGTLKGMWTSFTTKTRAIWNLWTKTALLWEAAIVWKNLWIAPEISEKIVDIAEHVPNILEISSELPWTQDFVNAAIDSSEFLSSLAGDMNTAVNLWAWWGAFALLYFLSRIWFWEKWRFEAGTSAFVWTALSVWLFKEMADVMNGYGHDIMSWLPLRAFESMPEWLRESFLDADSRRNIYTGITGWGWVITWLMAGKNLKRLITWIPKKKEEKKVQKK